MSSAGFDPTLWSHWLLVGCFFCISIAGLRLSLQWRKEAQNKAKAKQKRTKLARFLAMELHEANDSSHSGIRFPADEISQSSYRGREASRETSRSFRKASNPAHHPK